MAPYLPLLRARSSSLGDQLERALISVPLNVAEGAYSRGKNRQARYQSAAASAREVPACLETAEALGWVKPLDPELGYRATLRASRATSEATLAAATVRS
jgi:four helix bundle protein